MREWMKRAAAMALVLVCLAGTCGAEGTGAGDDAVFAEVTVLTDVPAEEPAEGARSMVLSFVGDCSLGDAVQYRNAGTSFTKAILDNGLDWPFSTVSEWFLNDDCTFANLEVVLTERANQHADKRYPLIGRPEFAQCLVLGGIDVVNTVNNHCRDFGASGYDDTMANLAAAGVDYFGSTDWGNHPDWDVLLIREVNGCRIGLVGISYPQNSDLRNIAERIALLREQGCQLVIVSLHWGREKHLTPNSGQYTYAQRVIDSGADVVWGHHPHVLQPVYFYNGKPIFFSTGNFVFGTISNVDPYTGIFQLTYDLDEAGNPTLRRFSTVPCRVQHGAGEFRPLVLTDPQQIATFRRRVYASRRVTGLTCLPRDFLETGEAWLLPDNSLSAYAPD